MSNNLHRIICIAIAAAALTFMFHSMPPSAPGCHDNGYTVSCE